VSVLPIDCKRFYHIDSESPHPFEVHAKFQKGFAALKTASSQYADKTNQTLPGLSYNYSVSG